MASGIFSNGSYAWITYFKRELCITVEKWFARDESNVFRHGVIELNAL